jgi:hypothetical protein
MMGYVYFIGDGDGAAIKIGYSASPQKRLAGLQTGSKSNLILLGTLPALSEDRERELHEQFADLRIRGEWFRAESPLTDFVAGLTPTPPLPRRLSVRFKEWAGRQDWPPDLALHVHHAIAYLEMAEHGPMPTLSTATLRDARRSNPPAAFWRLTMPARIQRKRTKGWQMPEGAVYVGRPGPYGNPFTPTECRDAGFTGTDTEIAERCVEAFEAWLGPSWRINWDGPVSETARNRILKKIPELRGKDLACWCPLDEPCHADVLLELANKEPG